MMNFKSSQPWITNFSYLLILAIIVGCTTRPNQEILVDNKPKTESTNPVTDLVVSPSASEIDNTPTDITPATIDTSSAEIPNTIPEFTMLPNPGFESLDESGNPVDWTHTGTLEAVTIEDRGHSGNNRLTHQSNGAYQIDTWQNVSGLENGWYTLRGWIRSSGDQNDAHIGFTCGTKEERVVIPSTMPGYRWLQVVVSNQSTDGECKISLYSDGDQDTWVSFDDIDIIPGRSALTIMGADISSLMKSEDLGGIYKDSNGSEGDALQILKSSGLNYARLRVFVDPADGYHGKEEILEMALRLKRLYIKLLVDFHYSDNWADPGKQIKPAAWEEYNFEQLKEAVYNHTFDICHSLTAQGTPADMVQIGNEINAGMLWPDADYNHIDNLAALLKTGYQAVKDSNSSTLVMLHIAEGGDNDLAKWWFGNITRREVPFDVIGISYYPFWHGSLGELQYNLNDITSRYNKDVILVETAYAFTDQEDDDHPNIVNTSMEIKGYPFSPEGQRFLLRDVMTILRAVPNGRGLGVFYWDATWTAVNGNGWDSTDPNSGNAWENQALFDFEDRLLPAADEFLGP